MKTLYLVRHAKSDWNHGNLPDIDRPLNERGYRDAHTMSRLMKEKKIIPDLIITSPAIRAISTALIFVRNFNLNQSDIVINPDLYESSEKQYLGTISQVDNHFKNIMVFGHNPIITNLVNNLTISYTANMPTCSIAGIRHAAHLNEWKDFANSTAELVFFDFPKNHV
jgi:phosphohistidine phosphatase